MSCLQKNKKVIEKINTFILFVFVLKIQVLDSQTRKKSGYFIPFCVPYINLCFSLINFNQINFMKLFS